MEHPLNSHLDAASTPHIAIVEVSRPLLWLMKGWSDLRAAPFSSLAYGLIFSVLGYGVLVYASSKPYLFTAAVSGFMLIAPLAAAGLYEISRRRELGLSTGFVQSFSAWSRNGDSLFYYGIMLALVALAWERISAILFAIFYYDTPPSLTNFYSDLFLSGDYAAFAVVYLVIGGALATLIYTLSAVSIPMLMDRDVDVVTAMATSAHAVGYNLGAMAIWGVILVVLIALGFATMMIGMVVLLPLAGHATWHAYRDLVPK